MNMISVVLVDDHPLFRQGVVDILSLSPEILVLGQAASGDEGWCLVKDIQPQVAILDVNLPGMNGLQIAQKVQLEKLPTRVIFLTAYDDLEQKLHAMNLGVAAYCAKDILPETLVWVIKQVNLGDYVYDDQAIPASDFKKYVEGRSSNAQEHSYWGGEAYQPLSAREMQVLISVTQGLSNKEIALQLGISQQTVKNHVTAILRKLDVGDRTQAALFAMKRGWVRLNDDANQTEG